MEELDNNNLCAAELAILHIATSQMCSALVSKSHLHDKLLLSTD